jgi:hypothetical protein
MKKFAAMFLIIILALFIMTACDNSDSGQKTVTVIFAADAGHIATFERTSSAAFLGELLAEIDELEILTIGGFMTGYIVGGVEYSPTGNTFIGVFTSLTELKYLLLPIIAIEFEDRAYFATGFGIDDMPLVDGATYLFRYETF